MIWFAMGAQGSVQQDGKSQEDASASDSASAGELSAEVNVIQEGGSVLEGKVGFQCSQREMSPSRVLMRSRY